VHPHVSFDRQQGNGPTTLQPGQLRASHAEVREDPPDLPPVDDVPPVLVLPVEDVPPVPVLPPALLIPPVPAKPPVPELALDPSKTHSVPDKTYPESHSKAHALSRQTAVALFGTAGHASQPSNVHPTPGAGKMQTPPQRFCPGPHSVDALVPPVTRAPPDAMSAKPRDPPELEPPVPLTPSVELSTFDASIVEAPASRSTNGAAPSVAHETTTEAAMTTDARHRRVEWIAMTRLTLSNMD
jgi:hypothetical protein